MNIGEIYHSESGDRVRIVKTNSTTIKYERLDDLGSQSIVSREAFEINFPFKVEESK